ncbi:MAG: hypothetical protein NT033_07460 [Candidatus Omnitrophica bacterium]|nr:hypothetical protein [Candidatus Omnitrophota bacterium]
MLPKLNKRAQTTAEYAILIAIVIGAVVAMQMYIRRGVQGRIRNVVDHVGSGGKVGDADFTFSKEQYEPYYASSEATSGRQSNEQEILGKGGVVGRAAVEQTKQNRQVVNGWLATDTATAQAAIVPAAGTRPATPTVPDPDPAS